MKRIIIPVISITIIAAIILYYKYSPESNALFPKCSFLSITGLKCPGCGSQRALHSILNGEFADAFKYNAFLVSSIPVIIGLLYVEFIRKKKQDLYKKINSKTIITGIGIIIIFWWIIRNIFNF